MLLFPQPCLYYLNNCGVFCIPPPEEESFEILNDCAADFNVCLLEIAKQYPLMEQDAARLLKVIQPASSASWVCACVYACAAQFSECMAGIYYFPGNHFLSAPVHLLHPPNLSYFFWHRKNKANWLGILHRSNGYTMRWAGSFSVWFLAEMRKKRQPYCY